MENDALKPEPTYSSYLYTPNSPSLGLHRSGFASCPYLG